MSAPARRAAKCRLLMGSIWRWRLMGGRRALTGAESSVAADLRPPEQRIRGHLGAARLMLTHAQTQTSHSGLCHRRESQQTPGSQHNYLFIFICRLCSLTHSACSYTSDCIRLYIHKYFYRHACIYYLVYLISTDVFICFLMTEILALLA